MTRKIILSLVLIFQMLSIQSQEFDWANVVTGDDYEYGIKSVADAIGNTYMIGYSAGSPIEYDGMFYDANGRGDAFFAKLDINKDLVWMKSIGGDDPNYFDEALDIHIDAFGDIYITFKSASNNFTYNGQVLSGIDSNAQYSGEGVLLKVNANGDYIWHDSGTVSSSFKAVTTDASGNVYLTGSFHSNIILGGTITLTNPATGTTDDMLVAKYQSDGTILWAKNAGGLPHNTFAQGNDIEIHPITNELIVLGKGDGEVFYDGVPLPTTDGSEESIVLISYTLDGTQNWIKQILAQDFNSSFNAQSLDISASGIIGACGHRSSSRGLVGFYTSDGSIITEGAYTSSDDFLIYSISFNEYNEAYLAGRCDSGGVLGVNPGAVTFSQSTGFVVKMDIFQNVQWVSQVPSSRDNEIFYNSGKLLYAGRIDQDFTYNFGQNIVMNNYGDALFGEITDYQLPSNRSNITGTIFQDIDTNCILNNDDVPQQAVIVKAGSDSGINHYSVSDVNGQYDISIDPGTYTVEILPNPVTAPLISQNCFTEQEVTITEFGQDIDDIDFPIEISECPLLSVDISSDRRRRCFESNTYVQYANTGYAEAQNVEVFVQLPEYVTFISSDYPYTIDSLGNYVFSIGTLAPNESGAIHIVDSTDCIDGITGLTQCTEAWITPANDCADALDPNFDNWDKSSITVNGTCINNTTVQFTITNISQNGQGDMQNPHEYRIYVDNVLTETSTFQLNGGETVDIDYPANGQTVRLEADQHPLHPGDSYPQDTIEGCGDDNGIISYGFVNTMPMDDLDPDIEVHCLEIIDSFDPNDKMVSPTGITVNHYLEAGTVLDYMIRFQNTGTDTAYTVVVVDELSEYLDPATIQWGLSSHDYTVRVSGTESPVLEFTFNEIDLPHSAVDELGSNGFVKFKVATFEDLPIGTEINNNANIYFDFNLPILTNTVQTIISETDPLSVETFLADEITIHPNPTTGLIMIKTNDLKLVEIYNINGILIKTTNKNEIDLSELSSGLYMAKIITNKGSTSKKIIRK